MTTHSLSADQRRFINDMAALQIPWGMQPAAAHLYAYLLICEEPVSLDDITTTLGMAKSSVSVAARSLEQQGLARRHTETGSKRLRYAASDSYSGFLVAQARLLDDIGRLTAARAPAIASGSTLRRLRYLAAFYRKMSATIISRVDELTDEFLREGPDDDLR